MTRTRATLFPLTLTLAAGLALAGCGSKASTSVAASTPTSSSASSSAPSGSGTLGAAAGAPAVSGPLSAKPTITTPTGAAPTTLVSRDAAVGTGAAAKAGDSLSVQYDGILYSTGKQFDASWDDGTGPFTFTLGAHMVITGWDQGLVGMKVGGRRELVIPPSLGYGSQANQAIPAGSTLVFVVDLVSLKPAA